MKSRLKTLIFFCFLNLYIEKSYDLIMYIPTYKFVFNVYAGLILVGLLYSMMVIGYLISFRRRIKTHIS